MGREFRRFWRPINLRRWREFLSLELGLYDRLKKDFNTKTKGFSEQCFTPMALYELMDTLFDEFIIIATNVEHYEIYRRAYHPFRTRERNEENSFDMPGSHAEDEIIHIRRAFQSDLCAICHAVLPENTYVTTPCKHKFHVRCIWNYMISKMDSSCQCCGEMLDEEDLLKGINIEVYSHGTDPHGPEGYPGTFSFSECKKLKLTIEKILEVIRDLKFQLGQS